MIWQILYPITTVTFGFVFVQAIRKKLSWKAALGSGCLSVSLCLGVTCNRPATEHPMVEFARMELNQQTIHERLRRLGQSDRRLRAFGSESHDYALNPPLKADEIASFETQHGIVLPEDYRYFITGIGNGGAGPGYGLFPFGQDDEGWWGEFLPIGDVGQPFPHNEAWNLDADFWLEEPDIPEGMPKDEEQRLLNEWDKKLEARYWKPSLMNGAIPISHLGCALRQWLVVHGDQRGYIWDDMRADHAGIAPVMDTNGNPLTFTQWYLRWLDEAERMEDHLAAGTLPYRNAHPRSGAESLTLFLLIVAGVLLGLVFAFW